MAVEFDAVGPNSSGTGGTGVNISVTPINWNHTCSGTNGLLVVCVTYGGGDYPTSSDFSVTYNGIPMLQGAFQYNANDGTDCAMLFYLIAPASGTNQVSLFSNSGFLYGDFQCGSVSYTGVDQITGIRNAVSNASSGGSSPATLTVSSAVGNMVAFGLGSGAYSGTSNQTDRWQFNQNGDTGGSNGLQSDAPGAASVSFSDSINGGAGDYWGIVGFDIIAASSLSIYPEDMTPGSEVTFRII